MVKTNIQTFTGEVEILSNLHVGDYLTANGDASNVLDVSGNVGATFFVGDGGLISNIATTLSDIVDQGNSVANVVQFNAPPAVYGGVGMITQSNVGIQNTNPLNTLSIADKIVIDKDVSEPSTTMNVHGKVYASRFEGDGGLLSNIATTLEAIIDQGNVSANVVQFNSATDYAGAGIITRSNVGIQNTAPVFNLSVGSNLHVNDQGSNVLTIHGNVAASNLNLGVFTVSPSHGLDQVCAESNLVTRPVRFSNVITAISAVSNIESAGTFISTDAERGIDVASNIDIGGRLKFDSNVFIDTLRVADVASNIVTYDQTTGELTDSGGTLMNKFAIVSEQPPSDFFANTTTVTNHGTYTLTTSNLAANSNTFNAFDGTANAWVSGGLAGGYIGGANVFHENNLTQLSNVHPTKFGDWLAIEFPYKTTLRHMKLTPLTAGQFPENANLYATNNDVTWSEIKYWEGIVPTSDTAVQTITVDATEQFKKYALVATRSVNSSNVAIKDWQLFTESFSIDGGKVAMAQQAATGGETVMDQSGPHGRLPNSQPIVEHPRVIGGFTGLAENNRNATGGGEAPVSNFAPAYAGRHMSSNIYTKAGYTVTASTVYNSGTGNFDVARLYDHHDDHNTGLFYCSGGTTGAGTSYSSTSGLYRDTITSGTGIDGKTSPYTSYGGTAVTTTVSGTSIAGEWLGIETPEPIILKYVKMVAEAHATYFHGTPHKGVFAGSHDGVTWESVSTFNNFMAGSDGTTRPTGSTTNMYIGPHILEVNSTKAYKYHRMIVEAIQGTYGSAGGAGGYLILDDLKWYGCNEDPPVGDTSVDTTFTSVMNTPQTTGTNVYVDGSLGETFTNRVPGLLDSNISNTHTTYVSAEKYWELSGNVESNVTIEANTFLSGDQPHAVSMWFNSSNLESNVSNSCIVSLGTDNKIDHISSAFTSNYQTVKKITADEDGRNSRSTTDSNFGSAVAINSDGTRMIVGALNEDLTSGNYGAAYIYTYSNGSWDNGFRIGRNGESYPSGGDGGSGDQKLGRNVDINDAGTKVIVGASRRDGGGSDQGAAYIYEYSNGQWNLEGFVTASNAGDDDRFGYGVAMSGDGTKIAVGAILEDSGNTNSGAVYIYTYSGGSWGSEVLLRAHDAAQTNAGDSHLGFYVAMNNDGTRVVAGAPYHDLNASDAATTDAGAAYVFAYSGGTWSEEAKIQASDIAASDYFGYNVDINSDGTKIVVGAKGQDTGGSLAGAVYVYTYSGGSWGSEQKIQASDKRLNNEFGWAVDFNTDGTKLIVGAIYHDGGPPIGDKPVNNSGAAYVFEYDGSNWNEVKILKAFDPVLSDHFGAAVGMSGDGKRVVVGAQNDDDAPGSASGSIYVYDRDTIHHCTPEFQLESNTWHNLTYTYEGRGGSRVTYLDGHKVSEDVSGDTYGPYPPFPMSNYFEAGYRASASEEYSSDYKAWYAFDSNTSSTYWSTLDGGYSTSWGLDQHAYGRAGEGTLVEGTRYKGAWLQLEMPHRLKVDVVRWQAHITTRNPYAGIVAGSNDGVTWYKIYEFDAQTAPDTNAPGVPLLPSGSVSRIGYKYVRIITTKGGGAAHLSARQVKIYGTKEGDIVRFPEPDRVLRYPHVELTDGPSKRGYRVSVSTEFAPRNTREGWMAFNDSLSATGGLWMNNETGDKYTNGTGLPTTNAAVFPPGGTTKGEWIKLELPHKIKVSSIFYITAPNNEGVEKAILYGSNDDTNWEVVKPEFTATLATVGSYRHATESVTTSNYYKYLVLQVTQVDNVAGNGGTNYGRSLQIYRLQYFGVEEGSVPIQIGGGNIDKVANFRVYNKFIDEDQALEIWDSQKDEFGRAKSSMTLHKGRIGLGTTEPEGRLAVLDEPYNLEEFPPRAMTAYKNYFDGHGEFCVSTATAYANYEPYRVFDRGLADGTGYFGQQVWHNALGNQEFTNTRPGLYIGQDRLGGYRGLWLKLELPYKIQPFYVDITPRGYPSGYNPNYDQNPKDFKILASNDDVNWDVLTNQTGAVFEGGPKRFNISSNKNYKYLAFIGTKTINGAYLALREMRYLGIREQGQSVLQDGQLTLTKSLNVPRIGPALDADNTPRRDRLMLEYNTTTNPTFERCIRDTSGNGLDGVLYSNSSVVYDAYNKSFENFRWGGFESMTRDNLLPINGTHTFSAWVRFDTSGNWYGLYGVGGNVAYSGNNSITVYIGAGRFRLESRGASYRDYDYTYKHNKWVHVVVMYDGTGGYDNFHVYVDKVKLSQGSGVSNGTTAIALPAKNQSIRFGQSAENDPTQTPGSYLPGALSSIKVYDTNLTYEEICTLYNMGRFDEGNHIVNFSKTRVGIGLGDGEAPSGDLDVRGHVCIGPNVVPKSQWFNPALTIVQHSEARDNGRPGVGIQFGQFNDPGHGWMMGLDNDTTSGAGTGNELVWEHLSNGLQTGYGAQLSSGYAINTINDFTGQHRCFIKDVPFSQANDLEGLIVSSDQNKYIKMSGGIEAGSNAITTNESLPVVSLSNVMVDKKCFGVISASEDPEQRVNQFGNIKTFYPKEKGDTRVHINSVGEGAIWVVNTNGSLESGDYITTSNVAGYGQKQDDDVLHNYTVAKITMDCDFNPATQPVQQILRSNVVETYYLGNVHHTKNVPYEFVTTTVTADDAWSNVSISPSDVTYAEWSNLEANTQNTYTLTYTQTSNVVYDTKYTLTTTANVTESDAWDRVFIDPPSPFVTYAEWSNLEANTQNTYTLTFTQTTTDTKTPEEWSALESNTQSLYNKVYYQSVEEEVAATWPGAVAHTRVTDRIENELDAHGQIQWENHHTETEKAYKLRYLTADGTQTDEANAVHIAAFVGCTYHCG